MSKNHEIRINLSLEEKEKILKKAESAGLSASAYARILCLQSNVVTKENN